MRRRHHLMDSRLHDATYLYGLVHGLRLPARLALQIRAAHPLLRASRPTGDEASMLRWRSRSR